MKQLVAYITAGFPEPSFSLELVDALKESGVDILELGIPFSDPVADGPVIEQAGLMALKQGFTLQTLFDLTASAASKLPTYWMGYFNPFYHYGFEAFQNQAYNYGVKGFIIPDLPYEEASAYLANMHQKNLSLISFVAPTDTPERIKMLVKEATGFIYMVAYAGITGARTSEDLTQSIAAIKAHSSVPVFVGFGVNEKTAKERAKGVDGVIVGSAFVEIMLDQTRSYSERLQAIAIRAKHIKEAINS